MDEIKNINPKSCHCAQILDIWWVKSLLGFFLFLLIFSIGIMFGRHSQDNGRRFDNDGCRFSQGILPGSINGQGMMMDNASRRVSGSGSQQGLQRQKQEQAAQPAAGAPVDNAQPNNIVNPVQGNAALPTPPATADQNK